MPKYKVKGTNILHNKKLYQEGSQIELDDKDAKKLTDYLIPIQEKKVNTTKTTDKTTKTTTNTSKTTSKTTSKDTETKNEETE